MPFTWHRGKPGAQQHPRNPQESTPCSTHTPLCPPCAAHQLRQGAGSSPAPPTCDVHGDGSSLPSALSARCRLGNQPANDASCGADGGPDAPLPGRGFGMQMEVQGRGASRPASSPPPPTDGVSIHTPQAPHSLHPRPGLEPHVEGKHGRTDGHGAVQGPCSAACVRDGPSLSCKSPVSLPA